MGLLKSTLLQFDGGAVPRAFGTKPLSEVVAHKDLQTKDAEERFQVIRQLLKDVVTKKPTPASGVTSKLDSIFVHPVLGYVTFLTILLIIFQVIYKIASFPMDWIDG